MCYRLLLTVTFILLVCPSALAFSVELSPGVISPGDPFVIKVAGIDERQEPVAFLHKRTFPCSRYDEGVFVGIGAVDVTTKPGIYSVTVRAGNQTKDMPLTVREAVFETQTLTLPAEKVSLSRENAARVERENRKLKALFSQVSGRIWQGQFVLPLPNSISTGFGTKRIMNREWAVIHKGLDIRGREGEEIKAANAGRVVLAEELFYGGNTVILDHGQGVCTIYMHLSQSTVEPDAFVSQGEVIGLVGMTGRATGPHLHFGVKVMGLNANPASLVKLPL